MKMLIKIIGVAFVFFLFSVIYAQHTVGENAILYVGQYMDDGNTRPVYMLDIENLTEPIQIGTVNQHGSETGWSPDGRYVFIINYDADDNRTLTLYDVNADTAEVMTNRVYDNECYAPVFWSPDGRYMAFQQSVDEQVVTSLWDGVEDTISTIEGVAVEGIYYDVWSPDGRYLALPTVDSNAQENTFIWDTVTQTTIATLQADMYAKSTFGWSPDGSYFVYDARSSDNAPMTIYDTLNGTQMPLAGYELMGISPDGRYVLTASYGDISANMYLYDMHTQHEINVVETGYFYNTRWSPDSRSFTFITRDEEYQQGLSLYDVTTGETTQILPPSPLVHYAFWSATSQYIAVVYSDDGRKEEAGELAIYNRETGELQHFDYKIPNLYYTYPLHWSPVGDYLVIDTDDSGDVMLDAAQNSIIDLSNTAETNPHIIPNWSADGQYMLFGGYDDAWHIHLYAIAEQVAVSLAPDTDWNGFIGWRGTNRNSSLIHCGMG